MDEAATNANVKLINKGTKIMKVRRDKCTNKQANVKR